VNGTTRLLLVAALLTLLLVGVAALAGYPSRLTPGETRGAGRGHEGAHTAGDQAPGKEEPAVEALPGVQIAQGGLRLALEHSTFGAGARDEPFSFRIVDARRRPVRDFDVQHDKRMHFIVVRRDLTRFQHLHPTMKPDGTWSTDVDFGQGGTYRLFADFTRNGEQRTLGADVHVAGPYRPRPLPAPTRAARSDGGLEIALRAADVSAGEDVRLEFEVRDGGRVVTDRLQPYLGAKGHLVALREGDLVYLHTHPDNDEPTFTLSYPSAGNYRLFAQLRYEGRVHTAAFTRRVTE
jgi:hypothetical protein